MKEKRLVTILVISIAVLSSIAASMGIFSNGGPGPSTVISVRGEEVNLYGKGVYYHMSAEVAPQGIAQDVITLFIGIPLLVISLVLYRKGSIRGKVLLAGVLGYFLTTYLFFTMMAMYNQLFLLWVLLLSLCFHAFYISFKSISEQELVVKTSAKYPVKFIGGFLIFCSVSIALLWLSIVLPPTLTGSIPKQVEHYTTLVVQALDLSIWLPAAFIAGFLLLRKKSFGYKLSSVYLVFLSLLMTALTAKVVAMGTLGFNIIPVVFIIPTFNLVSITSTLIMFKSVSSRGEL
jgi:hypothetical protein